MFSFLTSCATPSSNRNQHCGITKVPSCSPARSEHHSDSIHDNRGTMESESKPWIRRPDEPEQAYVGFLFNRNLGPNRSPSRACRRYVTETGLAPKGTESEKVPGQWRQFSVQFDWVHRAREWDIWRLDLRLPRRGPLHPQPRTGFGTPCRSSRRVRHRRRRMACDPENVRLAGWSAGNRPRRDQACRKGRPWFPNPRR